MLLAQDGRCSICRQLLTKQSDVQIDHCHSTGRVRGLLCAGCNTGLGMFRDNIESLLRAAVYLSPDAELRHAPPGDALERLHKILQAMKTEQISSAQQETDRSERAFRSRKIKHLPRRDHIAGGLAKKAIAWGTYVPDAALFDDRRGLP